jgi:hypothetical protein
VVKDKETGLLSRNCFTSMEQSNLNCYSKADRGFFKCCQGNMCNLNMSIEPIPVKTVGKATVSSQRLTDRHPYRVGELHTGDGVKVWLSFRLLMYRSLSVSHSVVIIYLTSCKIVSFLYF